MREVREGGAVVYKVYQEVDNKPVGEPSYSPRETVPVHGAGLEPS